MAYGKKYILSFFSDRGNDYRVEVLQQGFSGAAVVKSFGSAPMLNIEDGDGRVKGSSLAFSIQADTEGELSGLYTTNNKEYKVILYRNNAIYWQGYLLPELYSENYVDPPYDVAVTATDQLATLKDVAYQGEDELKSLLDIVKGILLNTKVDIPCKIHMQLSNAQGSLLSTSYISAAAYNGQSCYDVLNAILLSCNCSIMQMGNEWIISSYTDATTTYTTDVGAVNVPHCTIGQMGTADVCPDGSLTMVNAPALKGATVEYNHILRNSMLLNADCSSKVHWMYLPTELNANYPSETELLGTVYKNYFWYLYQKNLKNNNSLQLWQDVSLNTDTENTYSLSVKAIFTGAAEMLLVRIMYTSEFGTKWYLTNDGWKTDVNTYDVNSYIQITGQSKGYGVTILELSDKSKYETTTIRFNLPDVPGTLRVGFINSMSEDRDGSAAALDAIAVTDVYLVIDNVTGKTSTTLVESNATSAQEEVAISYGEAISSPNADKMDLSYLRYADGQRIESVELSGEEFSSYYLAMVQDFSRYYGVKKMQLQGALMGADVLHPIYKDVFSGKVLRLVNAQYNLLDDSVSVSLEEVPSAFVEYELVVYAKENTPEKNTTTSAGVVVGGGGGESYLALQGDGDVYVKQERSLVGKEARFDNVALPVAAPERAFGNTYIYSSDPTAVPSVDVVEVMSEINKLKQLGLSVKEENGKQYLESSLDFYSKGGVSSGGVGGQGGGGGTGGGSTVSYAQTISSGIALGTLTINGISAKNTIYAPSVLSAYTNDVGYITASTLDGYLPLSGGTINGMLTVKRDATVPLYVHTSVDTAYTFMRFRINNVNRASVGAHRDNEYLYRSNSDLTSYYKIYDEGNLSALKSPFSLTVNNSVGTSQITYDGSAAITLTLTKSMVGLGSVENTALSTWKGTSNITTVGTISSGVWNGTAITNTYINSVAWNKITSKPTTVSGYGITDMGSQTVASAGKLTTARSLWGNSFDGTKGFDGYLVIANDNGIKIKDSTAVEQRVLLLSASNNLQIGYDTAAQGYNTYIQGNLVQIRYGVSRTVGLILQSTGDIDIANSLSVGGSITMLNNTQLYMKDSNGTAFDVLRLSSGNTLTIGYGTAGMGYNTYLSGWNVYLRYGTARTVGLTLNTSGNVLIGATTDNGAKLQVAGNFYATGGITSGSDARYKTRIKDVSVDIETIAKAPLFVYKWADREDDKLHLGTTAQYWNDTEFKNAVVPTNNEKLWTMSYGEIAMGNTIVLAREQLKVKSRVEVLEDRVKELETELNKYRRA